jgi:hypothetical protein
METDQLKDVVERKHGGSAQFARSVPVRETFEGKAVWEGVNLRRGFLRLGIGLVLLWLVFWNCAYVISPYNTSLKPEPAFVILVTEWRVLAPCLIASIVLGAWIAVGFRSN